MPPLLILLLGLLAGIGAGYVIFQNIERRKSGGKTAAELKQEHEAYREQVQQHFSKTSDLFQNMTMQYRELYDHLSEGAQSLCESTPASPALELSNKALLPSGGAAPTDQSDTSKADDTPSSDDDDVPVARADGDDDEIEMGADASIAPQQSVSQTDSETDSKEKENARPDEQAALPPTGASATRGEAAVKTGSDKK